MAYFHKVSLTVTSASSKSWGTTTGYPEQSGYLESVVYSPDGTNPLAADTSTILRIRRDSTAGAVLFQSSSGVAGDALQWYPRVSNCLSTDGGAAGSTYTVERQVIMGDDKLVFTRATASSSDGSTQGAGLSVYIGG